MKCAFKLKIVFKKSYRKKKELSNYFNYICMNVYIHCMYNKHTDRHTHTHTHTHTHIHVDFVKQGKKRKTSQINHFRSFSCHF